MKPIEAVARAIWAIGEPGVPWEQATPADQNFCLMCAHAAILALAENVSEEMRNQLEDRRHDLAAAIRSAADE